MGILDRFTILSRQLLNSTVVRLDVYAPLVAKKAKAGQFVIVRAISTSERIPLTVADTNTDTGSVSIIFQIVGGATAELSELGVGDKLADFVGPLGEPSKLEGLKKVAVVGGGVGCAIAYPTAKALSRQGTEVHSIVGFRNKDLVILEDEFRKMSSKLVIVTDDGSYGAKGLVTDALAELIEQGENYDEVIAIGPIMMMKFVSLLTKQHNIPTVVSMNPIMIDGTGMCGCCRLTVGGEIKFACVDGPDFDGHLVDYDEAMVRGGIYKREEQHARDNCRLFAAKG